MTQELLGRDQKDTITSNTENVSFVNQWTNIVNSGLHEEFCKLLKIFILFSPETISVIFKTEYKPI